jgi:hypothetical protein
VKESKGVDVDEIDKKLESIKKQMEEMERTKKGSKKLIAKIEEKHEEYKHM